MFKPSNFQIFNFQNFKLSKFEELLKLMFDKFSNFESLKFESLKF